MPKSNIISRFWSILSFNFFLAGIATLPSTVVTAEENLAATASVESTVAKALDYLSATQLSEDTEIYWKGEWTTQMRSYFLPALLGVGRLWAQPVEESSLFTTASIANLLSELYLLDPSKKQILEMLTNAAKTFPRYQSGDLYNFYNWVDYRGKKVRGPTDVEYITEVFLGLTNIPDDADTTSVAYLTKVYEAQIRDQIPPAHYQLPSQVLSTFAKYRDSDRSAHYFNGLNGISKTGAFMTWFQDENDPKMTKSLVARPDRGTRIPFGSNDVDCVVNANVLRLLSLTQNQATPGYQEACTLLNQSIERNKQAVCGIYYPNSHSVFFTVSNAYAAGAKCLEPAKAKILDTLLGSQNSDGSWENEPGIGRRDPLISTAWALNSILNLYGKVWKGTREYEAVERGIEYILNQKRSKNSLTYWDGEVFFSAVAQARNTVLWRSSAYTTALVAVALTKAEKRMVVPQ